MMTDRPSAFVLVGPTASGKSSVAQLLAEPTGVPIVSADSMSIYRGMNVGTAKPSPEERAAVPYFGIDLVDPTEAFSVGDWLSAVRPAWGQSSHLSMNAEMRGLTPIVAGGTGLYVKCLLQGLDDLPAADEALRSRTGKMTLAELQVEAQKAAPAAYETLTDKENPRRLVRLMEQGGCVARNWTKDLPVVVGLHVERDMLHKRIVARVEKMYAGGLLEETRELTGLELSSTARHAIGYAEAFAVLRGELIEAEAKERTIIRTRQLAKRQMTWFRHQLNVQWIETADFPDAEKLALKIYGIWENSGAVPVKGV